MPVLDVFARNTLRRAQCCGSRERGAWWLTGEGCSPERGENLEGVSLPGTNSPRLKEEVAGEALTGETCSPERLLQESVGFARDSIASIPEHCRRTGRSHQFSNDIGTRSRAEDQRAPESLDGGAQSGQRMVKPPL